MLTFQISTIVNSLSYYIQVASVVDVEVTKFGEKLLCFVVATKNERTVKAYF